ncbi:membrane protein [Saccharothrix coeruleofusca]|uniref:YhjD/YihY/BrkB family envelope integrity protein n=1 Tax=Saccharothrix coeruleofusca TaxID=33919 RepID=UPI001AE3FD67|nr:YhjD/YihY/BrkB family envelope integrity protein [Saccharothrix coeruleofusca]MBP2334957.1 membrane protein [Saccharothrix coeruleofusca]
MRTVRAVLRHALAALRGRDLALWAAGITFFAALAVVPVLLLALRGAAVLFGPDLVTDGVRLLSGALPDAQAPGPALRALTDAALGASWPVLLSTLLPASLYGEGLRRGLLQIAGEPSGAKTGWLGRIGFLPVLLAAPLLVAAPLALAPSVAPDYRAGGWSAVWGVVVSFHVDWVALSVATCLVFLATGPSLLPRALAVVGGFCAGAVLTGFLHGFLLFLAIPVDWAFPFAGLEVVGAVAALGLWLYLLHIVLLLAYRVLLSAHEVRRSPPRT